MPDHGEISDDSNNLKRSLTLLDLILYGVGSSIGAGIYSLIGLGASIAGPAVSLSFLLCGIACVFTSLAYAEFAARIPIAGSAYTYVYITLGEIWGWIVGWNLTLGYGVSAAVVARSWAEYMVHLIQTFFLQNDNNDGQDQKRLDWLTNLQVPLFGNKYTCSPLSIVIIFICTTICVTGAKESTTFNSIMTLINLSVLATIVLSGLVTDTIQPQNLTPFFPSGLSGISSAAGLLFFSYLGFDMVACLSEEVKDPQRNMPRGIVGSLLISITIYISVSIVIVGMAPISLLGVNVPISNALVANVCCTPSQQHSTNAAEVCLNVSETCSPILHPILLHVNTFVSVGAIFGLTTATFTCLMGQPRIFYRMAKDGLLFEFFGKVDEKSKVPVKGSIVTGILVGLVACFIDLEVLANMISLGTLQVFTLVNAGVIFLRMRPSSDDIFDENEDLYNKINDGYAYIDIDTNVNDLETTAPDISENGSRPIYYTVMFTCSVLTLSLIFTHYENFDAFLQIIISVLCILPALASAYLLHTLPQSYPPNSFQCPLVPTIPLLGIGCNAIMMGSMPLSTWGSIGLWMLVGGEIYLGYGMRFSKLRLESQRSILNKENTRDNEDDNMSESGDLSLTLLLPREDKDEHYDTMPRLGHESRLKCAHSHFE